MNNKQFVAWLRKKHACEPAIHRVGDKTPQEVWDTWFEPYELLWWMVESRLLAEKELAKFACGVIRNTPLGDGCTVWDLLTDERSRTMVEVVERWVNDEATNEEISIAQTAAIEVAPQKKRREMQRSAWAAATAFVGATAIATNDAVYYAAGETGEEAKARANIWQLAYSREHIPDFVERFTKAFG